MAHKFLSPGRIRRARASAGGQYRQAHYAADWVGPLVDSPGLTAWFDSRAAVAARRPLPFAGGRR